MIEHTGLENRLNAIRRGQPIPGPDDKTTPVNKKPKEEIDLPETNTQYFISEAIGFISIFINALLYGYGISAIFSTDWSFAGLLGVGFIAHQLTYVISHLFRNSKFEI